MTSAVVAYDLEAYSNERRTAVKPQCGDLTNAPSFALSPVREMAANERAGLARGSMPLNLRTWRYAIHLVERIFTKVGFGGPWPIVMITTFTP
jgi:hypothetical protein